LLFLTVVIGLLFIVGIGAMFIKGIRGYGAGALILSLLIVGFMSATQVGAKTVGVITSFGKISERTLTPGLSMIAPWEKVIKVDGTIQSLSFDEGNPIKAKIADGSEVGVRGKVRWEIVPAKANELYGSFRDSDPTAKFSSDVVMPTLQAKVQESLENYNPIAQVKAGDADQSFNPDYAKMSEDIKNSVNEELAKKGLGQIESVVISYVSLSEQTQSKLNDFVSATGETRIAEQRKETARAQAEANKILSNSVSNNPNVLVSRCMDTVADAVEKNYALPAGFSCWSGGGSVVIPGANSNSNSQ